MHMPPVARLHLSFLFSDSHVRVMSGHPVACSQPHIPVDFSSGSRRIRRSLEHMSQHSLIRRGPNGGPWSFLHSPARSPADFARFCAHTLSTRMSML
ncbi:hypothetical protein PLICRDRAFT_94072 [Plicaturopsis crispa FD-325 SS-3]|nr:hypothetical protein PLICRDRAFT_94072 [Plicaturopsis crispa FD-325 SS-3]